VTTSFWSGPCSLVAIAHPSGFSSPRFKIAIKRATTFARRTDAGMLSVGSTPGPCLFDNKSTVNTDVTTGEKVTAELRARNKWHGMAWYGMVWYGMKGNVM
jgi:hypothetical protein